MTEDRRPAKKPPMRDVLAEAAFALFLERGFERTTVDDIVARAGVGRRSFFRYFPSKEDAVFPDHERCLADMTAFLAAAEDGDPVATVCDAARLVLRMYAENPEFSVQRYRLTREVPGLRTYELSVVRRYERTLAGYLERRWAQDPDAAPDAPLRAEVIAASVVAAHNNGLRSWLRSGGRGDAGAEVDRALELVRTVWGEAAAGKPAAPATASGQDPAPVSFGAPAGDGEVIVMVARKGAPMWRVVQHVEAALGGA
ncbi:TetR/AcrR family transcriptional regulator [Streptomyces sp. OfavH-34-F]|uniref:TetR family transcriptional regulator n=1 Tax=Streptomyces sp. OfavH-34-F TaxID=2917760 RepID=UPI001EF20778|nr:TetR family transcriptional regulator [Streptomyces sp. OfavH-34-F]MCG7526449.1 TetR/AcrR family transcriptional regulator [Streptomyces sp. OfavH-34-F]